MFRCETCDHQFPVGLDQSPAGGRALCDQCGRRGAVAVADHGGEHVVVDRAAFAWRPPAHWDVVVFRCPHAADRLCVKRVVGLPGETVALDGGDVWIDGSPARKTLAQQQALRQLVSRLAVDVRVPPGPDANAGLSTLGRWRWTPIQGSDTVRWLEYRPRGGKPITDASSYNQRTSYELHPVPDVMLTFRARLEGDGKLLVAAPGRGGAWLLTWDAPRRSVQLHRGDALIAEQTLPPSAGFRAWTLSLFDRQVLVAIDGRVVMAVPDDGTGGGVAGVDRREPPAVLGGRRPTLRVGARPPQPPNDGRLAIGTTGLRGEIRDLAVWRDVYYARRPADRPLLPTGAAALPWRLGPAEYFVLGDNAAVSDDSRSWLAGPGLDARLVIGKPLYVR